MPVFRALEHLLTPLREYGFSFIRHGDDVLATVTATDGIHSHAIPARDLIEAVAEGDDPCEMFAEAMHL